MVVSPRVSSKSRYGSNPASDVTCEPERFLRLVAEMRPPGRAWLQLEVTGEDGGSIIRQTAIFDPHGLAGLAYWYALYPLHVTVFSGMLRGLAKATSVLEKSAGA